MRKKIQRRIISFAMTAILTVTGMTTTALAVQLDDNPSGSTTSIGAGDTMENNWGTIDSNEGHLTNNEGDVLSNGGDIDENWGNVTNVDNGSVGTNHTGGEVTDGSVTENYGTTNCSIVTNNYQSGTVNSGTLENNYLGQTDGADVTGVNILDEGAVPDGIPINDPKPNAPAEPEQKKEEPKSEEKKEEPKSEEKKEEPKSEEKKEEPKSEEKKEEQKKDEHTEDKHHDDDSSSGDSENTNTVVNIPVDTNSIQRVIVPVDTYTENELGLTNALTAVSLSGDESAWVNYDMGSDTTITETMLRTLDDGTGHCIRSVQMTFMIDGKEWFFVIPKGASLTNAINDLNLSGGSKQVYLIYKLIGANLYYMSGNLVVSADLVFQTDGQNIVSQRSERSIKHALRRAQRGGATTIMENVEE